MYNCNGYIVFFTAGLLSVTGSERVSQTRSRGLSRSVHLAGDNEN